MDDEDKLLRNASAARAVTHLGDLGLVTALRIDIGDRFGDLGESRPPGSSVTRLHPDGGGVLGESLLLLPLPLPPLGGLTYVAILPRDFSLKRCSLFFFFFCFFSIESDPREPPSEPSGLAMVPTLLFGEDV